MKPKTVRFSDIRKHHILTEIAVLRTQVPENCDDLIDDSLPHFKIGGNEGN
jgi:hypothetical protein